MEREFKRGVLPATAAAALLIWGAAANAKDPIVDKAAPDFKATSFDGK